MAMDAALHEKLRIIFSDNGYPIYDETVDDQLEIDSLQFLSVMCDIESRFDIEIPDEFLIADNLGAYNDVAKMIESVLNGRDING